MMSSLLHIVRLLSVSVLVLSALSQSTASTSDATASSIFDHATIVSSGELQDLKDLPTVSVVYYYKGDLPIRRGFYQAYDNSAKYLKSYNVKTAVFDCTTDKNELCEKKSVDKNVYTYQKGVELLVLEVDVMFDLNSIMSNVLQLVLLHEVPIIQSRLERLDIQKSLAGKKDLIFSYPTAVGTEGHRIFMEIAYIYHDRYKFAVTTEYKTTKGLDSGRSDFSMWVLFCSEAEPVVDAHRDWDCRDVLYRGKHTLTDIAKFMNELSQKTVYHAPADGVSDLFDMESSVPIIYIYQNKETQREIEDLIGLLSYDLRGMGKLVVVDMDDEECKMKAEKQGVINRIPTLSIKTPDGKLTFMDQKEKLTVSNMQKFVAPLVFPPESLTAETTFHAGAEDVHSTDLEINGDNIISQVETQDDQVAEAVFLYAKKEMDLELVPSLTVSDFHTTVKKAQLLFVLFYLPYDHVSMAFLRDFGHASRTLAKNGDTNVLARVNCYDATDLCGAENITTYPVLRIYRKNQDHEVYKGPLDSGSINTAVKLLQLNSPVNLKTEEEVELFFKGEYPHTFAEFTPSSVLLLVSSDSEKDGLIQVFKDVAYSQSIFTAFAIVKGDVAKAVAEKNGAPVSSVIAYNRKDTLKPMRVLSDQISVFSLINFVQQSLIATLPELTVTNFPALYARKKPFFILFLDKSNSASDAAMETMTTVAQSEEFETVTFCWMDAQAQTMGLKILSEYTWTAILPMITVVDHRQGEVYNYKTDELIPMEITDWLRSVLAKKVAPSKIMEQGKWVNPGPHYDFLHYIDHMKGVSPLDINIEDEVAAQEFDDEEDEKSEAGRKSESGQLLEYENLEVDKNVREELLQLRHQSPERIELARKQGKKQDQSHGHVKQSHEGHSHIEL